MITGKQPTILLLDKEYVKYVFFWVAAPCILWHAILPWIDMQRCPPKRWYATAVRTSNFSPR